MTISAQQIKDLREKTGAGIADVKKALEEADGNFQKAFEIIERKLGSVAIKKAGRETGAGLVDAYIHSNARVGALIEVFCETDFVAKTPAFKEFAHDLALHIAAMRPVYLSLEQVPENLWQAEKAKVEEEVNGMDKPANIKEQIVDGKLKTYFGSLSLLSQPFIKDQDKTIDQILAEAIGRFGENIKIGNFSRFEV